MKGNNVMKISGKKIATLQIKPSKNVVHIEVLSFVGDIEFEQREIAQTIAFLSCMYKMYQLAGTYEMPMYMHPDDIGNIFYRDEDQWMHCIHALNPSKTKSFYLRQSLLNTWEKYPKE
jgi:hypothetical protein